MSRLKGRLIIAVVLLLSAAQFAEALAQSASPAPRIGYLGQTTRAANPRLQDAFVQGLRELGWVEGTNLP